MLNARNALCFYSNATPRVLKPPVFAEIVLAAAYLIIGSPYRMKAFEKKTTLNAHSNNTLELAVTVTVILWILRKADDICRHRTVFKLTAAARIRAIPRRGA